MKYIKLFEEFEDVVMSKLQGSSKIWYHGSNKLVKKFSYKLIGKNSERISNYHGWGIYFTSDIHRAESYGNIIIKVEIDYNVDILEDRIKPKQLIKVYNQLIKENVKLRENDHQLFNKPAYGEFSILNDVEEFYDFFIRAYSQIFKSIKDVSDFLIRCGIDGLITKNDVNTEILVIFNENVIHILK